MYFRVWAPRRRTVHVVVESASRRSCALFPDGSDEGLYHTADATLWFFHALHRYLEYTHARAILPLLMPTLLEIYERHRGGTRFGIGMDAEDGLLRQGAEGYQLTWMDAKGGDWVVTPRRGKAVEVNALWYNALCLLESWLRESGGEARAAEVAEVASLVKRSFNRRFWYEGGGTCTTSSMGRTATAPSVAPFRSSPFRSITRCSSARDGSRCFASWRSGC
jgi:predicted glycogen debranching enzyme